MRTAMVFLVTAFLTTTLLVLTPGCSSDETTGPVVSSLSYRGHESDRDSHALVAAFPQVVGTRIDDCQTCHRGGSLISASGKTISLNPCSFCHLLPYPDAGLVSGTPADYEGTLNAFGLDYRHAGRSTDAVTDIADVDSDGDQFTNRQELEAFCYPGDPESRPGQPVVPIRTFDGEEVEALAARTQFLLLNSHKQEFDTYAVYTGVTVRDLLEAAGADLSAATGVTLIAPDGYAMDFTLAEIDSPYPAGLYCANLDPGSFTDPAQGFVEYPPSGLIPPGLQSGQAIPGEPWMMVAYGRDGGGLDQGYLDAASGRLNGEGPYRLVVPQSVPGCPDRGSTYSPSGYNDGYDYDDAKDHNAGVCVRAVVAVRVNPLPEDHEEFDWKNGGWALVERRQLIVYGAGVDGD